MKEQIDRAANFFVKLGNVAIGVFLLGGLLVLLDGGTVADGAGVVRESTDYIPVVGILAIMLLAGIGRGRALLWLAVAAGVGFVYVLARM